MSEASTPAPADPSPPADAEDPHDFLQAAAVAQDGKDQADAAAQAQAQEQDTGGNALRQDILKVLKVFKDRGQELEGLKDQDPELYEGLVGMLKVLIEMSRSVFTEGV